MRDRSAVLCRWGASIDTIIKDAAGRAAPCRAAPSSHMARQLRQWANMNSRPELAASAGAGSQNCPSDHGRWNMSLSKSEKDRIRQLKAMGHSDRKIAQTTGHSRNTVADVLARPIDGDADNDARRREREARRQLACAAREVPWLRPQGHVSVRPLYGPQLLGTEKITGRGPASRDTH